jgi:acetyltransferase-like isoleucine patch superfamily enzyme
MLVPPVQSEHRTRTIGESAVIGAGSLVNSDIPAFAVAVGSPARVINRIDVEAE